MKKLGTLLGVLALCSLAGSARANSLLVSESMDAVTAEKLHTVQFVLEKDRNVDLLRCFKLYDRSLAYWFWRQPTNASDNAYCAILTNPARPDDCHSAVINGHRGRAGKVIIFEAAMEKEAALIGIYDPGRSEGRAPQCDGKYDRIPRDGKLDVLVEYKLVDSRTKEQLAAYELQTKW